jgi:hypothetical protein
MILVPIFITFYFRLWFLDTIKTLSNLGHRFDMDKLRKVLWAQIYGLSRKVESS